MTATQSGSAVAAGLPTARRPAPGSTWRQGEYIELGCRSDRHHTFGSASIGGFFWHDLNKNGRVANRRAGIW
jgi:hypothetical protein